MPGYGDLSIRRTIAIRSLPRGSIVETPTKRRAKVIGYGDDGRVDLLYLDDGDTVRLKSELLTLIARAG